MALHYCSDCEKEYNCDYSIEDCKAPYIAKCYHHWKMFLK